jgi:hypothetical protein
VTHLLINIALMVGLVILLVALLGLGWWAFTLLSDAMKSPRWPTVGGTVTSSRLVANRNANGLPGHHYRVGYEFDVGGRPCIGSEVRFGSFRYQTRSLAQRTLDKYPVGQAVKVSYHLYFDPNDPANDELEPRCVLEPGLNVELWYPLSLFFLTFCAFGSLVSVLLIRIAG